MTAQETALQAYDRKRTEATYLATRIADALMNKAYPAKVHWGHAGDMTETVAQLRRVSDAMFSEGEYAPDAQ